MGKIFSYAVTVAVLHLAVAVCANNQACCWHAQDNGPSLFLLYPLVKMCRKNGEVGWLLASGVVAYGCMLVFVLDSSKLSLLWGNILCCECDTLA
jgi:hypothetical protein